MSLNVLYRGPLSSCNYECAYCPFAKREDPPEELARDKAALERFVEWVARRERPTSVLFTPWGEALVRRWYQDALARLTSLPHVERAAIQTNLSMGLEWADRCDKDKLALWSTFHPTEISRERFVAKVRDARSRGIRLSVGVVGLREHLSEIEALRKDVPDDVYVWVNAYKREPHYYSQAQIASLTAIDPFFSFNNTYHASLGRSCRAGSTAISVDGDGVVRRCHFIKEPIGNIYSEDFSACLVERPCTNATCGCHIGYVHLDHLKLYPVFGKGLLERIPEAWARES